MCFQPSSTTCDDETAVCSAAKETIVLLSLQQTEPVSVKDTSISTGFLAVVPNFSNTINQLKYRLSVQNRGLYQPVTLSQHPRSQNKNLNLLHWYFVGENK